MTVMEPRAIIRWDRTAQHAQHARKPVGGIQSWPGFNQAGYQYRYIY
jgi:hypothetical protein